MTSPSHGKRRQRVPDGARLLVSRWLLSCHAPCRLSQEGRTVSLPNPLGLPGGGDAHTWGVSLLLLGGPFAPSEGPFSADPLTSPRAEGAGAGRARSLLCSPSPCSRSRAGLLGQTNWDRTKSREAPRESQAPASPIRDPNLPAGSRRGSTASRAWANGF